MIVAWIVFGMVITAALAKRIAWSHARSRSDLGFVSHQWLAEQRRSQPGDGGDGRNRSS